MAAVRCWFRWPRSPVQVLTRQKPIDWSTWHLPLPTGDVPACGAPGPSAEAPTQLEKQAFHLPFPRCGDCDELARPQAQK